MLSRLRPFTSLLLTASLALPALSAACAPEAAVAPAEPAAPAWAARRQAVLAYGEPCEQQQDCETQVCLSTWEALKVCTSLCSDEQPCPPQWSCHQEETLAGNIEGWCLPPQSIVAWQEVAP